VDEAAAPNVPTTTGGAPTLFTVEPALPAGLTLDGATGEVAGTPSVEAAAEDYVVTASNAGGSAETTLNLVVGPALPPEFASLKAGFAVDVLLASALKPVKLALAPDGRLFFNELDTGNVRILDAQGGLQTAPFATLPVITGGHRGLLGLALAPDFALSGHVYAMACTPAAGMQADRVRVVRWTEVAGAGTNETVILDDLPISTINDGGELVFDLSGDLFVSLGDVENPALAQDTASPAGKVLRITPAGGIPADNPDPTSRAFCLGLRNTFGMAVHPTTGGLFGVDNGPAANDELNFVQPGKNFEWGAQSAIPGSVAGFKVRTWPTVIVPTALAWHHGGGWAAEYQDDLFLTAYDDETIRRFEMSGTSRTDVDAEEVFAQLDRNMTANKPLDLLVAPDGSILFSTFTTIYRIRRL
jgi:glucose/arabinose dehydrogenase